MVQQPSDTAYTWHDHTSAMKRFTHVQMPRMEVIPTSSPQVVLVACQLMV